MGKSTYLIDSNIIIDYLEGRMPAHCESFMREVFNEIPKVSIINRIEVLGYKTDFTTERLFNSFFNDVQVFDLSATIADRTIHIRKMYKIALPDAIIAATAMEYGLTIITRNTKDFSNISGVKMINPHIKSA